jgi:hypothetical protein
MSTTVKIMVMIDVAIIMPTMEFTTAEVVARPTAEALRPLRMP